MTSSRATTVRTHSKKSLFSASCLVNFLVTQYLEKIRNKLPETV
jgi:hypothetical protein